jgi:putative transposase
MFRTEKDFLAFEKVLIEAHQRHPLPLLDWCLMPNHWHMVVYPRSDRQVTDFFRWLTHTHSIRWHASHKAVGIGPLYQGRFKTLPVETDDHLLTLLRYVGRNPLRAKLVTRAQQWRWCGEFVRQKGPEPLKSILGDWPVDRPNGWLKLLNEPQTDAELAELREATKRSRPYGSAKWVARTSAKLQLEWTLNPRGRPRKHE